MVFYVQVYFFFQAVVDILIFYHGHESIKIPQDFSPLCTVDQMKVLLKYSFQPFDMKREGGRGEAGPMPAVSGSIDSRVVEFMFRRQANF